MTLQLQRPLDDTDWHILRELQTDARLSYNELGRRVGLSGPAVAERVRRLEDAGIIKGYRALIDPPRVGLPLTTFIQMRCAPERCLLKTTQASDYPEIVEIHKLSGPHCTLLKVLTRSMPHLEAVIERLGRHGEMTTSVVLSTPLAERLIDRAQATEQYEDLDQTEWGIR